MMSCLREGRCCRRCRVCMDRLAHGQRGPVGDDIAAFRTRLVPWLHMWYTLLFML